MSVPRKGRLPAWHLLTDEGGSVNSRFLSALFPSAAQAHAAAEVLEQRGVVLLAVETEPRSIPQPLRRSQTWLDWTSRLRWLAKSPQSTVQGIIYNLHSTRLLPNGWERG